MANPWLSQKMNGKYLWFCLLSQGFQPDTATSSIAGKINVKHINLGPNMFDKPNKDAFYIVTHFLLEKLNPTRFIEAYRNCWPVLDHRKDAEFRKVTCAWLREIMDETGNAGSKVVVVPSLLLSPGGPKFTSLMLNLAKHVMLQDLKTCTTDGSWVPAAAATPAPSLHTALKRLDLITARFLRVAVDQDRFQHEYHRRAQVLVKSFKDLRSEGVKYDELLKHRSVSQQEAVDPMENIRKVRSLWSAVDGMLRSTSEDQSAVESVLKGDVSQYVLDGTDRVLTIPQSLLERVERLPHQLSSGNVYQAGQLNLLTVLELTGQALQLLKEERCRVSAGPRPALEPADMQEKCQQLARALPKLHSIRQKISREGIPEVRSAIRELESQWDRKWKDTLKETPLASFLYGDPTLDLLSPMAPLSFEPVAESGYSIFSQYPATLLEEQPAERRQQDVPESTRPGLKSFCAGAESPESPAVAAEAPASHTNTSLDWLFDTPPSPPVRPAPAPPLDSVRKTTQVQPKVILQKTPKTQILDLECDNLADQFADALMTSPAQDAAKGLDLQGLLRTLQRDPFSTRKQLPRTPESLIKDVKSSWHKALEEDKAEKQSRAVAFDDTVMGCLTPTELSCVMLESHVNLPLDVTSCSDAPVSQQRAHSLRNTQLWDTFAHSSISPNSSSSSSAVALTLDQETLPSCDSLLSLDDNPADPMSDDELLIPSLEKLSTSHGTIMEQGHGSSLMASGKRTPECLLSGHAVSPRLVGTTKPAETTDQVFSLELDALETPSPPRKQEYSLPRLITFSPIDDMKC